MLAAFRAAALEGSQDPQRPLVFALGDMQELGPMSAALHRETLGAAIEAGAGLLLLVGPRMASAAQDLAAEGRLVVASGPSREQTTAMLFASSGDLAAAAPALVSELAPCVLLVKGSRSTGMERVSRSLHDPLCEVK